MSTESDKFKHSKRQQQKANHINRQMNIRKAHQVQSDPTHHRTPFSVHPIFFFTSSDIFVSFLYRYLSFIEILMCPK
jgi:hypothetical protein